MKQKELEMELLLPCLEEEGALELQYENEALDARDCGSYEGAALRIWSRSPVNWKNPRSMDVFGWIDKSDKIANIKICGFDYAKNEHDNYWVSFHQVNLL